MNNSDLRAFAKKVLIEKNIGKLPRTLASRLDDHASAEFFNLGEKAKKYEAAVIAFCDALKSREFNSLPESVKGDVISLEALQSKAVIHARRVRELSELRQRLTEKEQEVNNSLGKIPLAQREQFGGLLVELQNVLAMDA